MDDARLEGFLARLYTDAGFLERFIEEPQRVAREAGLSDTQVQSVLAMDMADLRLAAGGYRAKGARAVAASHGTGIRNSWRRWWRWHVRMPIMLRLWRLSRRESGAGRKPNFP